MFGFENLEVWRKAIEFADFIYDATRRFPDDERYGLRSQMRRSAVSVSSNLAEGSGRGSNAEFSRFVGIGYGSLMECISQSHVARRQRFLTEEAFKGSYDRAERLARMLSGLRSSLQRS